MGLRFLLSDELREIGWGDQMDRSPWTDPKTLCGPLHVGRSIIRGRRCILCNEGTEGKSSRLIKLDLMQECLIAGLGRLESSEALVARQRALLISILKVPRVVVPARQLGLTRGLWDGRDLHRSLGQSSIGLQVTGDEIVGRLEGSSHLTIRGQEQR